MRVLIDKFIWLVAHKDRQRSATDQSSWAKKKSPDKLRQCASSIQGDIIGIIDANHRIIGDCSWVEANRGAPLFPVDS